MPHISQRWVLFSHFYVRDTCPEGWRDHTHFTLSRWQLGDSVPDSHQGSVPSTAAQQWFLSKPASSSDEQTGAQPPIPSLGIGRVYLWISKMGPVVCRDLYWMGVWILLGVSMNSHTCVSTFCKAEIWKHCSLYEMGTLMWLYHGKTTASQMSGNLLISSLGNHFLPHFSIGKINIGN